MICKYLVQSECQFAKTIVGIPLPTTSGICQHCLQSDQPSQLNRATGSLVAAHLLRNGKFNESDPVHAKIKAILTVPPSGVGTELKKLISWFPVPGKSKCKSCKNLELKMNRWGPEVCSQKIDYIIKKLEIAARRRSVPFVRIAVKMLVETAIRKGTCA